MFEQSPPFLFVMLAPPAILSILCRGEWLLVFYVNISFLLCSTHTTFSVSTLLKMSIDEMFSHVTKLVLLTCRRGFCMAKIKWWPVQYSLTPHFFTKFCNGLTFFLITWTTNEPRKKEGEEKQKQIGQNWKCQEKNWQMWASHKKMFLNYYGKVGGEALCTPVNPSYYSTIAKHIKYHNALIFGSKMIFLCLWSSVSVDGYVTLNCNISASR